MLSHRLHRPLTGVTRTTRLLLRQGQVSCLATVAQDKKQPKAEGTIASVFASLSGDPDLGSDLPQRFANLKSSFVAGPEHAAALTRAWNSVLDALKSETQEIASAQDTVVPEITYPGDHRASRPLADWVTPEQLAEIKRRGVVIIKGVVEEKQALAWKSQIQDYARANPQIRGFPEDNKQVYEMYWSKSQIEARGNPNLLNVTRAMLQLFHAPYQSANRHDLSSDLAISLNNPVVYADRLRIRQPGDAKFALGPHIDSGGVERWEDKPFRTYWSNILEGECDWRKHDSWSLGESGERLAANGSMYEGPGGCSIFRPLQGWMSMSHTKRNEGTLRVFPLLKEATAYIILRPFFRPINAEKPNPEYSEGFLASENWVFDPTTPSFPGCSLGHTIELNNVTHPHLLLPKTMTSIPQVNPGDMVIWHTDVIHAVEAQHRGKLDSSVMYIPAIPLTKLNWGYVQGQRDNFIEGIPPADFPGGEGEKTCVGRATKEDIQGNTARRAMGLEKFDLGSASTNWEKDLLKEVNATL